MQPIKLLLSLFMVIQLFEPLAADPSALFARSFSDVICNWQLTFNDEFDTGKLDRSKWKTTYGSGGNGERQYYAHDAFEFEDSLLRIRAEERWMEGYRYTSGIIHTRRIFDQQYGFFKIRAKVPEGQGLWPAFWLLTYHPDRPLEIDVFEHHGHEPDVIYQSNHWRGPDGERAFETVPYAGQDFTAGFHEYAVKWTEAEISWYTDGRLTHRTREGIPNEKMYLLANLAVGGIWPGNPDKTTPFPAYYEIDYIRVYQHVCVDLQS